MDTQDKATLPDEIAVPKTAPAADTTPDNQLGAASDTRDNDTGIPAEYRRVEATRVQPHRRDALRTGRNILFGAAASLLPGHPPSAKVTAIAPSRAANYIDEKRKQAMLDEVQRSTLNYFTKGAHPHSGMAYERTNGMQVGYSNPDVVTTGGTGFGIMAMIAGAHRTDPVTQKPWLDRKEAVQRITKIIDFLSSPKVQDYVKKQHGVFPHFMDGNTGKIYKPSWADKQEHAGDLVETSFLMMGLLTARQYFSDEKELCRKITKLWEDVDWTYHVRHNPKSGKQELFWHVDAKGRIGEHALPITGWNECLVTHLLAAASPTHYVSPNIYHNSWAQGGQFKQADRKYRYGDVEYHLPLGPEKGGPLFLSHYSFMGLDPTGLKDRYVDNYFDECRNHVLVNRAHCLAHPERGYNARCWGLTSSDSRHVEYWAHSPTEDLGIVQPTASLSSFPYTPHESYQALEGFLAHGEKLKGKYGFKDSFAADGSWYADSELAIDQGPIVVMMENYRSGLLWKNFMRDPDVQKGLMALGFESPHLSSSRALETFVERIKDPAKIAGKPTSAEAIPNGAPAPTQGLAPQR